MKHQADIKRFVANGDFEITDGGILIHNAIKAVGTYTHGVNGGDFIEDHNAVPDAAILDILNTYWGAESKKSAWYVALFAGALTPPDNLTASNFAATMTEITSQSEGYSELTRPQFTPAAASGGTIGNLSNKAHFTIVTATSLMVEGAALLSTNSKGGTAGVLSSASRFANPRELFNGDDFECGYTVSLTD